MLAAGSTRGCRRKSRSKPPFSRAVDVNGLSAPRSRRPGHVPAAESPRSPKVMPQGYGMVLWDEVFASVAVEFPEIATESLLIDRAVMEFVRRPESFDVVVASNLFGDILTDLAAILSAAWVWPPARTSIRRAGIRACSSRFMARPPTSPARASPTLLPRSSRPV